MKTRRILCMILALCMILPLFSSMSVFADITRDTTWQYRVEIYIASDDHAEAKGTSEAILATLSFEGGDVSGKLSGCNKKNKSVYTQWLSTTNAPWTINKVTLKNVCSDALEAHYIGIKAKSNSTQFGSGTEYSLLDYYPSGAKDNKKGGKWIGGKHPNPYEINISDAKRKITSTGDFTDLAKDIHLKVSDAANTTAVETWWNSMVKDQYSQNAIGITSAYGYNAMCEGSAPTMEITNVSGTAAKSLKSIQIGDLKGFGIEAVNDTKNKRVGYKYTPGKLFEKMADYGIGSFEVTFSLKFPDKTATTTKFDVKVKFTRDVFTFLSVNFKNAHYIYSSDRYYNRAVSDGIMNMQKERTVYVKATIDTTTAYNHLDRQKLEGKRLTYDDAYLLTKDSSGNEMRIKQPDSEIKTDANGKKYTEITNGAIELGFDYNDGFDSDNNGLKFIVEGGSITDGNAQYLLWDEANKKNGYETYNSTVKIDAKAPDMTITADGDFDSDKWYKYVTLNITPNESIYKKGSAIYMQYGDSWTNVTNAQTKDSQKDLAQMELVGKGQGNLLWGAVSQKIYKFNHDPNAANKAGLQTYLTQDIPAAKDSTQSVTIELSDAVEGEYDLLITGEDVAGNVLKKVYSPLKLDNKPPEVAVIKEEQGVKTSDTGNITNKYYMKISDASGTGRIYYMFTEKSYADAIKIPTEGNTVDYSSNEEYTTLTDKWKFLDQKDIAEGKGNVAALTIGDGEEFNGRLVYFAVDSCENKSDFSQINNIAIKNESTAYTISPMGVSVPQKSYDITVLSGNNAISYRWRKTLAESGNEYLFEEYRPYKNSIDTQNDEETKNLNGQYTLELKIVTPEKTATINPTADYYFDNEGPEIKIEVPTNANYRASQSLKINATDSSGVDSEGVTAQTVNPDGSTIEGSMPNSVAVEDAIVSYTYFVTEPQNGAYALKVEAADIIGNKSELCSDPFFIRNAAPEGDITVKAPYTLLGEPLISDDKEITISFDIKETFKNPSYASTQMLYYRAGTSADEYGQWTKVGEMNVGNDGFYLNTDVCVQGLALNEGENTLYVQTMICPDGIGSANIDFDCVKQSTAAVYLDKTAPKARLATDDIHTTQPIEGKLIAADDISDILTAECDDENVQIGEYESGMFDITVLKNVDTLISVFDEAQNRCDIKLTITGIDNEAPTAEIATSGKNTGARLDAAATVTVYGMKDVSSENSDKYMFALIPTSEYSGGDIPEQYFKENLDGSVTFNVTKLREEKTKWEDETDNTYSVEIAGADGEWYIGVRCEDSLGNGTDIVFTDNPLTAKDAELSCNYSVSPEKAEEKAVVTAKFNVPVYTLPQDKIVNTGDADNFELAQQWAMTYSDKASFTISKDEFENVSAKTYTLYTVDDLGREKSFDITVTKDTDVTFGASGELVTSIAKKGSIDTPITEMICAANINEPYVLVVEPINSDTLLLPEKSLEDMMYDYSYRTVNGLHFNAEASGAYAFGASGDDGGIVEWYDYDSIIGYTKLVYDIEQLELDGYDVVTYSEATERILHVRAFNIANDPSNPDNVSDKYLVVSNIDNTAPSVTWSANPEVLTRGIEEIDGELYETWIKHPTPGNVEFTLFGQDKESGIEKITALIYTDDNDLEQEITVQPDENGYWSWDGSNVRITAYKEDEDGNLQLVTLDGIPLTIECYDDGDKYGIKVLKYTFTDAFDLTKMSGFAVGCFENTLGAVATPQIGNWESGISTVGIIYKMPIEENKDYKVVYKDENGNEITDLENTYLNSVCASVEILERGEQRDLYIANNGGKAEKWLDIYQTSFEFKLKDKYGYEAYAPVSWDNIDTTPGDVEYTLSATQKTNTPITVTITAEDSESGVGSITLGGAADVALTKGENGAYTGTISQNGTYRIEMYDKAGNRTAKSFTIDNYSDTIPEASVVYSCGAEQWTEDTDFYTSQAVTATLTFTKPNVRITNIEPIGLSASDYAVNYGSSVITFTKSGSLGVYFEDDYGNSNATLIAVGNIDFTPPTAEPIITLAEDLSAVEVRFNKLTDLGSKMDINRTEQDIYVSYGGVVKPIADENGTKNSFIFRANGSYTFKVYDNNGLVSYVDVTLDKIDTKAPVITQVKWYYEYEEFDEQTKAWVTKTSEKTFAPTDGTVGYRIGTDSGVTNGDVTVTVTTDTPTRIVGSTEEYNTAVEKAYGQNGLFMFDMEKQNGMMTSYGVDVQVIDKTPPIIDLYDMSEMVFYENSAIGEPFAKDLLKYGAYDMFHNNKTDLTDKVEIDWGGFDPDNFAANTFDSSKPYTITYRVSDAAHNITEARRTIRLVGMYDTVVLVNGELPDFTGRKTVSGDSVTLSLKNFSGTSYVRYQKGVQTMGQMKKSGEVLTATAQGEYELSGLSDGWYTFYVQTDKRDYFIICVYISN